MPHAPAAFADIAMRFLMMSDDIRWEDRCDMLMCREPGIVAYNARCGGVGLFGWCRWGLILR